MHKERWSGLVPWPRRLTAPPPRLEEVGVTPEQFREDTVILKITILKIALPLYVQTLLFSFSKVRVLV